MVAIGGVVDTTHLVGKVVYLRYQTKFLRKNMSFINKGVLTYWTKIFVHL